MQTDLYIRDFSELISGLGPETSALPMRRTTTCAISACSFESFHNIAQLSEACQLIFIISLSVRTVSFTVNRTS